MSTKTASVLIKTEPEIKSAAEEIFAKIGTTTSGAINIFLHKVVEIGGLPFDVALSTPNIPNIDLMSQSEINAMLNTAYDETLKDGGAPLEDVLKELNSRYGF